MTVRHLTVFGICFLFAIVAFPVHAQIPTTDLGLIISPSYPQPYQTITITPQSTAFDLSSSQVTITVNGTVIAKGSGAASATTQVGGPGSVSTIKVTAVNNGTSYTASLTVHPADVALILEPRSTAHPFYEGGSLVAPEGRVHIVAIPDFRTTDGTSIPASDLVYTWKNDDQILQSSSGIGRYVLDAIAPVRYRDTTITLTATTQDQSLVAQASIPISPVDPTVRVYQNDPLLGPLFNRALSGTLTMTDAEETFRGVAYNFAAAPSFGWNVNGTARGSDADLTVRPSGSGSGTAVLDFTATRAGTVQSAKTTFSVAFGTKQSLGVFGL